MRSTIFQKIKNKYQDQYCLKKSTAIYYLNSIFLEMNTLSDIWK